MASPGRARHVSVTPRLAFNFVDVYIRKGLYPVPLPSGLGTEAAGIVQEIGPGVTEVKVGDRIAYMDDGRITQIEERPAVAEVS